MQGECTERLLVLFFFYRSLQEYYNQATRQKMLAYNKQTVIGYKTLNSQYANEDYH